MPDPEAPASGLFMPEEYTPLYYTSLYPELDPAERRCYTRSHLLYFHEQLWFFESTLPDTLLRSLLHDRRFVHLHDRIRGFIAEEKRHAAMFRELNRRLAPELYERGDLHFVAVPRGAMTAWRWASAWPPLRGAFLWLMLVQEEKALSYTRGFLASPDLTDEVRQAHRRHMAEEVSHHAHDVDLLGLVRELGHPRWRRSTARCFAFLLRRLFLAPRRGGWRAVQHWLARNPRFQGRRATLRRELFRLDRNPDYVGMMYGRDVIPRSWALMESCPETRPLRDFLSRRIAGEAVGNRPMRRGGSLVTGTAGRPGVTGASSP